MEDIEFKLRKTKNGVMEKYFDKQTKELQHDIQKWKNLVTFLKMSTVDFNAFWI